MSWIDALAACGSLRLGGDADWRLPSRIELLSLVDFGRSDPAIDDGAFSNALGLFWSATEQGAAAWGVDFADGLPFMTSKSSPHDVRCVRQAEVVNRFMMSSDGATTLDRATGLRWANSPSTTGVAWIEALSTCSFVRGGYSDWRLPTIKELATLLDSAADGPPWLGAAVTLWSATPSVRYSFAIENGLPSAWRFEGGGRNLEVAMMSGMHAVACVRSE